MPAILEASPYRLTDGGLRDWEVYPYWAGFGYACARVDLRGTGDSDGLIDDEYTPQEQRDVCEIIAWLAAQPWCAGNVGMTGISWTGFNSLQVAALRPPALKAIVTLMSTDDRYADDVHYKGGCVSGLDMLPWGGTMLHFNALPAHPQVVGSEGWTATLAERLEANRDWTGPGWPTSAATTTGNRARSARTTAPSRRRSTRSAAGPTATTTPSCACWPACRGRARA